MSNESHGELLHRVKNHLSVIFGFVELALEDPDLSESVRGDLGEIKKAAQSALLELPNLERAQP